MYRDVIGLLRAVWPGGGDHGALGFCHSHVLRRVRLSTVCGQKEKDQTSEIGIFPIGDNDVLSEQSVINRWLPNKGLYIAVYSVLRPESVFSGYACNFRLSASSCSSQVLLVIPHIVDLDQPLKIMREETLLVTDVSHLLTFAVTLSAVSLVVSSDTVIWTSVQTFLY